MAMDLTDGAGGADSELEIRRELNLPCAGDRLQESGLRHSSRAEYRIDLRDIRTVEQVEGFADQVETRVLAERKILQKPEIRVRQHRAPEGVAAEPQRPRGQREGAIAVGIDACQRVYRSAALDGKNRRHLDMCRPWPANHGGWADWTGPGGPRPDIGRAAQRRLRPLAAIDRQGIAV